MRSQVNMTWNEAEHHHTILFFSFLKFFSSGHGITYHFLSWHVMNKLHVMNIFLS
jgi:hypothetical protein